MFARRIPQRVVDSFGVTLSRRAELLHGPVRSVALGDVAGPGMVDQRFGQ